MRRFYLLLLLLLFSFGIFGQNNKADKNRINEIKASNLYYWGESGECENPGVSDSRAFVNLCSNIRQTFKGQVCFFKDVKERQLDLIYDSFKDDIEYQTESIRLAGNNVFKYYEKKKFDSLCQRRYDYILSYIKRGHDSEATLSLGDALKSYYTALLLCYSHPNGNQLDFYPDQSYRSNKENIITWLVNKINGDDGILRSIGIVVTSWEELDDRIKISIHLHCNIPQGNLVINYYDPKMMKLIRTGCNVENGDANFYIGKCKDESTYITINFSYPDLQTSMPIAHEINRLAIDRLVFSNASRTIEKPQREKKEISASVPETGQVLNDTFLNNLDKSSFVPDDEKKSYERTMEMVEEALANHKNLSSIKNVFTADCFEYFCKIMRCDSYDILKNDIDYTFIRHGDEVICHCIPVQYEYDGGATFGRSLTFRFDRGTGKISSVAFRLSDSAEIDIIKENKWDEDSRLTLISFLEDYQTAYMAKDTAYLNKIFSEDALIIVGHKLEKKTIDDRTGMMKDNYGFTKLSKKKYIENLGSNVFKKKYVNIRFTDVSVAQSGSKEKSFGINVAQHFATNVYADNGYLFLYVDLEGKYPTIFIRTWQPNATTVEEQFTIRKVR